jgi:hypothetical protein
MAVRRESREGRRRRERIGGVAPRVVAVVMAAEHDGALHDGRGRGVGNLGGRGVRTEAASAATSR